MLTLGTTVRIALPTDPALTGLLGRVIRYFSIPGATDVVFVTPVGPAWSLKAQSYVSIGEQNQPGVYLFVDTVQPIPGGHDDMEELT